MKIYSLHLRKSIDILRTTILTNRYELIIFNETL